MTYEVIHNAETGEIIERPFSKEELVEVEKQRILIEAALAEQKALEKARLLVLEKLGLTEDEVKLLFQ